MVPSTIDGALPLKSGAQATLNSVKTMNSRRYKGSLQVGKLSHHTTAREACSESLVRGQKSEQCAADIRAFCCKTPPERLMPLSYLLLIDAVKT